MSYITADLWDEYKDTLQIALPLFKDYGGKKQFHGNIRTLRLYQDNKLVSETVRTPGEGNILVIDGGASLRCALLGDRLAKIALDNGWAGVVISGCVRDTVVMSGMEIGVKAMASNPRRAGKEGGGQRDVPVYFADVSFVPGHYLYADADGIAVSEKKLPLPS